MSIFRRKRGDKIKVQIEKSKEDERKIQFNVVIDRKLKDRVKKMAKICRIPLSPFAEHSLEVGLHHIEQTLKDEKKRKILEEHLEIKHLLGKKTDDEEVILRLSENNTNWILLDRSERMLKKTTLLARQALEAGQANNIKSMERYKSELFKEMVYFINWISELRDNEKYRV